MKMNQRRVDHRSSSYHRRSGSQAAAATGTVDIETVCQVLKRVAVLDDHSWTEQYRRPDVIMGAACPPHFR